MYTKNCTISHPKLKSCIAFKAYLDSISGEKTFKKKKRNLIILFLVSHDQGKCFQVDQDVSDVPQVMLKERDIHFHHRALFVMSVFLLLIPLH